MNIALNPLKPGQVVLTIKAGSDRIHVCVADHAKRLQAMHSLARAGIVAGFGTIEGFQANTNLNFWGSK